MNIGPVNWMWGALTPLTPPPPPPGPPPPARPVPPRNTWPRHATGTRRAHQWEIDRLADGVREYESSTHAPRFPYRLGIHGTVWRFRLSHLGVRAPYAARRKRRYEANQVWMNTTFISQGLQSWGKLAVETWRVKTELIIITILHIIIITASILNLGFKTIVPKILAHTKMHK